MDDSKDYVYSTSVVCVRWSIGQVSDYAFRWDDNRIRSYLQEHGVIEPPATPRNKLLAKMKETYASIANPAWKALHFTFYILHLCRRGENCVS